MTSPAHMDAWTIILMLGATALWTSMVAAVVYAARVHRAGNAASVHR